MQKTAHYQESHARRAMRHLRVWVSRKTFINRLVAGLLVLAAICGVMTYAALTNVPPFGDSSSGLIILLNINLVILLALVVFISKRIIELYIKRRKGIVGSNLHIRLVFVFSLLAALPAMFMAVFSVGFFYFGLHGWLDDRVRTAINESQAVAEAYLSEHQQLIRADILALAADLNRQVSILADNEEAMGSMLRTQSYLRNFENIHLFTTDGTVILSAESPSDFDPRLLPKSIIDTVKQGNVGILEDGHEGIMAIIGLDNYPNLFIHVERAIDPQVLAHVERAKRGVEQYQQIEKYSTRLQVMLTFIYLFITLLLTIAATWFGLSFARRLMTPITDLINASEKARQGDLSIRVDPSYAVDEFKMLGHAFNRMTKQIESQQQDLVSANTQMDFRRRFTETILGGVSTGVLSVDHSRRVTLANNAAGELLGQPIDALLGQKIPYIMPELTHFLDEAFAKNQFGEVTTCEIQIRRQDKAVRVFIARIVIERLDNFDHGAIITFDDLTAVLANQRKAAWADIARRIAHEIKNPLTPIQLSAERLNRKYSKNMNDKDRDIFEQCTGTIIRHVSDIKRMVNSFAEFAKMPDADIQKTDIIPVIKEVMTLSQSAHSAIRFSYHSNIAQSEPLIIAHDSQQIRQALTNLIKNAVEAFDQDQGDDQTKASRHHIGVLVYKDGDKNQLVIGVADDGPGLPKNVATEKLSEPYVTHKAKGTGLGLAIVKKIVEDHQGDLLFNPKFPMMGDMTFKMTTFIAFHLPLGDAA